ncbi:MAG TPA: hypothetical protein VME66_04280 [Candidatus Acidoferrales bacterium]|nr:hypothetical protein [Candidatus Acidoferrales bacterium]
MGAALLEGAQSAGCRAIAVVGTAKNVGKSVTVGAICAALARTSVPFAVVSTGRDGESVDSLRGTPKPPLFLRPGALFVTARSLLPAGPAVEILAQTRERSAVGAIVLARARAAGCYEIAGPPSVAGMRRVLDLVRTWGEPFVVLDGALDRLAVLSEGDEAIVVATGAASGRTVELIARDVQSLVRRLQLPLFDVQRPSYEVSGALTLAQARALALAGERRQIVVHDATRVAFGGATFGELAAQLDLRCRHVLRPIAVTTASVGPERFFEPRALLCAVARATRLPAYDVFAQACA